jgi:hypothetical protein
MTGPESGHRGKLVDAYVSSGAEIRTRLRDFPDAASSWYHQCGLVTRTAGTIYLAECRMPSLTDSDLALLHGTLAAAARRLSRRTHRVRYLRSTYVPAQGRLLCWFEATDGEIVRAVNESAQAPYVSLDTAIELLAPSRPRRSDRPPDDWG